MNNKKMDRKKLAQYLVPYFAVLVGLYVLESAWITFLLYHGLIIAVLWKEKQLTAFRLLKNGWRWLVGGGLVVFGLGGGALFWILGPSAGVNASLVNPILARIGLAGVSFLIFILYHMLVNPWMEEAYWRGFLGSTSKRLVWGDVAFAGYHVLVLLLFMDWYWSVLALIVLSFAAWLWRQLATRYEGLLVPALSHLFADGSIMIVVWLLLQ